MNTCLKPGTLIEFVGLPTHYFNQPYGFTLKTISNWKIDSLFSNIRGIGMIVDVCPEKVYAKNMIPELEKEIGAKEYYLYKAFVNQTLVVVYSFFVRPLNKKSV